MLTWGNIYLHVLLLLCPRLLQNNANLSYFSAKFWAKSFEN